MSLAQGYIWSHLAGGPVKTDRQGMDYLIVLPGQKDIEIYFLQPVLSHLEDKEAYEITGGERGTAITILNAVKVAGNIIRLTLDRFGDWAPYQLAINETVWEKAHLDPVFTNISFSFKVSCPNDIDCRPHGPASEAFPAIYHFDYQAKDYESLKQAMLDRLTTTLPQWWDQAEADFGIVLVDLLAYVGDRLSYYQDRVAAESQLLTARSRASVAGHLQLLDYFLDPGETAVALLALEVDQDLPISAGTRSETPARSNETPVSFTLIKPFTAYQALNQIKVYDFNHASLSIPEGSLQITVPGHLKGLAKDKPLIVCQGNGQTGLQQHLVVLSGPPLFKKGPAGEKITVLNWDKQYALPWDAALSETYLLGNIAVFENGTVSKQTLYVDQPVECYDLPDGPLSYRAGQPLITVKVDGEAWQRVISLKQSRPDDAHFQVVDLDNDRNRILFGDNENGLQPQRYAQIEIEYQTGLGRIGNVAANTITRLPREVKGLKKICNPFPGQKGRDPETEAHAKLWGPKMIREQKRAVTPEDYMRETQNVAGVSRAMVRFVWTGSWVTVRITIDPEGKTDLDEDLRKAVYDHLLACKMAGYDVQIYPVRYVALEMTIRLCLQEQAFRDQVLRDLQGALGNDVGADGAKGLFHPDNWTFGQAVTLSRLYAAIAGVQGIECAEVLTFKRLNKPVSDELTKGEIPMQWDEIAQLDNDRSFPEHGKMNLQLVGGR
jgi:hypothetical protein